jgi:hypothetical protein
MNVSENVYALLVEDEDARVCKDIPEAACDHQPASFTRQLVAQTLTKLGDALTSSRLVLAWMLSSIGASPVYISMLVPLRESFSLLPQLFIAQWIREHAVRKWYWVAGSVCQALALAAMVPAILLLPAATAAPVVVALLAVFSLARGVCSVAAKDVLGKTISKSRRGALTGMAASAAGLATLGVAAVIWLAPVGLGQNGEGDVTLFGVILGAAALLWLIAAAVYGGIPEVPGATEGGGNAISEAIKSLRLLVTDRVFLRFVVARMLLVATAFSIPYLVVLIQKSGSGDLIALAGLLCAEGAAGLLSGPIWGRWADRSSHIVMSYAAVMSACVLSVALILYFLAPDGLSVIIVASSLLFVAFVAHQGARIGRKTYLLDMSTSENRSSYTAVSNTVLGVFLLSGGALGVVDALYGLSTVLLLLLLTSVMAALFSRSLRAVD